MKASLETVPKSQSRYQIHKPSIAFELLHATAACGTRGCFQSYQRKEVKRRSNSNAVDPERERRCSGTLTYRMEVKE